MKQPTERYKQLLFPVTVPEVHALTGLCFASPERVCLLKKIQLPFKFPVSSWVALCRKQSCAKNTCKQHSEWVCLSFLFFSHQVLNGSSRMPKREKQGVPLRTNEVAHDYSNFIIMVIKTTVRLIRGAVVPSLRKRSCSDEHFTVNSLGRS